MGSYTSLARRIPAKAILAHGRNGFQPYICISEKSVWFYVGSAKDVKRQGPTLACSISSVQEMLSRS